MADWIQILIIIIVACALIELFDKFLIDITLRYENHIIQIKSSNLKRIWLYAPFLIIIILLYEFFKIQRAIILYKNNNLLGILALVFGVMAVYIINFSIMHLYDSRSFNKPFLGIYLEDIPSEMLFLNNIEQSPLFVLCLLYFTFIPFIDFARYNRSMAVLWEVSLTIIAAITLLNIILGYNNRELIKSNFLNENVDFLEATNRFTIEENLKHLFKDLILKDIFYRKSNNQFLKNAKLFIDKVPSKDKAKFLNIIYCPNIEIIQDRITNPYLMNYYQHKLINKYPDLYNFEINFNRLICQTNCRDYDYLIRIFKDNYSLFKSIMHQTGLAKIDLKHYLEERINQRYANFNDPVTLLLFPEIIFENKIKNIDFWNKINENRESELNTLINSILDKPLHYTTQVSNYILRNDYSVTSLVEYDVQYSINFQLENIHYQDNSKYRIFVGQLCNSFGNYSVDYIQSKLPDLKKELSTKQYSVIEKEIKRDKRNIRFLTKF